MSGTSLDGVDVALVEIGGEALSLTVDVVGTAETPFPPSVREEVFGTIGEPVPAARISQLDALLGIVFAQALEVACERLGVPPDSLDLVGSHGQTLYHQGEASTICGFEVASTMQVGEPAHLARVARAPVVFDFRSADVAAGGHGAPLVPFADYLLFRHERRGRVALNVGGIANLTAIPAGADAGAVIAFDTGPGNMVIDSLVSALTGGSERFDRDGRMASRGAVDEGLLAELLDDPYYGRPAPKSTGRERYGAQFADRLLRKGLAPESLVATAAQLTARSILMGIERFVRPRMPVDDLVVSGGGWRNPAIIQPLRDGLPGTDVLPTDEFGIGSDAKEAVAFAILAYESFHGRPANLPSATGAAGPVVLGRIAPAPV